MLSRLLKERIVYVGDGFTEEIASAVVLQLQALETDSARPASLYINSRGGSLRATLAIYEAIQNVGYPLTTVALGRAEYAAALLVAAGPPGQRVAAADARFVLGPPIIDGAGMDFQAYLKSVQVHCETLNGLLALHTGQTLQALAAIAQPLEMSAQEALRFGLVDRVLPRE